jgi:hypothetical protein
VNGLTDTQVEAGQIYCYTVQPYNLGPTLFDKSEPVCGALPFKTLYLPFVTRQ